MNFKKFSILLCLSLTLYLLGCSKTNEPKPTPSPPAALLPAIASFSPIQTGAGGIVTIVGTNFTGVTAVTFGGTVASAFTLVSATTITATVASGSSGEVKVTTNAGSATIAGFVFNYGAPVVSATNSSLGTTGSLITLTGNNFVGATAVKFGASAAAAFTVISNTSIRATVGAGSSGEIAVTTPQGTAILQNTNFNFQPLNIASGKLKALTSGTSLGFPRTPNRISPIGEVKIAVIFVDFSDAVATRTTQDVFSLISPGSENFLNAISFGKLNVVFETKHKWHRMSKPATGYGFDALTHAAHKSFIQEAVNLAESEMDFSKIDEILVITNPDTKEVSNGAALLGTPTSFIIADGKIITNAMHSGPSLLVAKELFVPHELGHSMGLPDLYAYTGLSHRFVGGFSAMGNLYSWAPEYNAWERWQLGWFTDQQVRSVDIAGEGTIDLTPVETKDGMKLLILPINQTSAVIVEDRRAIGYDVKLPKQGPVVYLINTMNGSGIGALNVLPLNELDGVKASAPLSVGQTITYENITVKCVTSGPGGSTIEFQRK